MNSTFSSRLGPLRRRRVVLAWVAFGVVGAMTAASLMVFTGQSADAREMRTARDISAGSTPGFAGALAESANPAGDAAPPIALAPLAGAPEAGMSLSSTRPVHALADHPIFAQHIGLHRVHCELPDWDDDPEAARAFYRAAIACLDASWQPTLRGAGLPFHPPRLIAPAAAREVSGRCTTERRNAAAAYYCAGEGALVLPFDTMRPWTLDSDRGAQLAALTIEYGHHVQAVIGILRAYEDKRFALGWNTAAGQEQSRRLQLQARCFSGMFLGTNFGRGEIDQPTWDEAASSIRGGGDDTAAQRLRGTEENVWGWWKWGSDTGDTWECNTWYSSSPHVE